MLTTRYLSSSLLVIVAALVTTSYEVRADNPRTSRTAGLLTRYEPVPLDVREVSSTHKGRRLVRAIVSENPFGERSLVLQKLTLGHGRRQRTTLRSEVRVERLFVERTRNVVALDTRSKIRLEGWSGPLLNFSVEGRHGMLRCQTVRRPQGDWQAQCDGAVGVPEPLPPPPPVFPQPLPPPNGPIGQNWSADPGVIRACGDAFTGSTNEAACLDAMVNVFYHPSKMIGACDAAMDGDTNELACVRLAVPALRDPSAQIDACERAMDGDTNELACLRFALGAPYDLSRGIAACEAAMDGDVNELRCIEAIARGTYDLSQTIRACDDSMTGDTAELSCIERAVR